MPQLGLILVIQAGVSVILSDYYDHRTCSRLIKGMYFRLSQVVIQRVTPYRLKCGPNTTATESHCICNEGLSCFGRLCSNGRHPATGRMITGFSVACTNCLCLNSMKRVDDSTVKIPAEPHTIDTDWILCAVPNEFCKCKGTVRLFLGGLQDSHSHVDLETKEGAVCSTKTFGLIQDSSIRHCACSTFQLRPPSGALRKAPAGWVDSGKGTPRLLVTTTATHREPFIGLLEQSVRALGPNADFGLHIAGGGDQFTGYGYF